MKDRIQIADLLKIPERIPPTVLPCIVQFGDNIVVCQNLVFKVHQELKDLSYSRVANHNFAVNLVSQLELLSKRTVLEFKDLWDKSSYDSLLTTKITFNEAFNLMQSINAVQDKKQVLTIEHLISEFNSFSNFDSIMKVFTALLGGKNIYAELAAFKISEDVTLVSLFGENWQNEIRNLFEIRNRFVHEGALTENIDYVKLHDAAYYFGLALYFYLLGLQGKTTVRIKK